jgi:amino acid permease
VYIHYQVFFALFMIHKLLTKQQQQQQQQQQKQQRKHA